MGYAPNIDAAQFLCNDILPLIKKEIPTVKILLAGAEPSLIVQNLKKVQKLSPILMALIQKIYAWPTMLMASTHWKMDPWKGLN